MAAGFLPPVVATLLADIGEYKAKMTEARDEMAETEDAGKSLSGAMTLGIAAAIGGVAYEAVKLGTSFQAAMELLATQAGVPQSQIAGLSQGVLQLAGQVGFAPDSLAEALYHIESSFASVGITGPQALNLLQIAAEGAAVGHADLVDVTNALDAAVVSGIPGVQNLQEAMGELNATVGAGDMSMQDLASAFSTGLLANVKSFGLSFTDVGAALAVFGDNNIRGTNAATELRMAVQAMAKPAATAGGELSKLGLNADTLATVMSKQGLLPALDLLKAKMTAAGVTAQTQGQVLTDLFGKKAGAGIVVLYDQLDRLKSKYPVLTDSANNFGSAWEKTKGTFSQAMKSVSAEVEALLTQLGLRLMPIATKVANWFITSVGWLQRHKTVLEAVALVIGGALVYGLYAAVAATIAWTAALDANPIFLVIEGVVLLVAGLIYAYTHFKRFRDIVDEVGRFFKAAWQDAVKAAEVVIRWFGSTVLPWIEARIGDLVAWWKSHGAEVIIVVKTAWNTLKTIFEVAWEVIKGIAVTGFDFLKDLWRTAWEVIKGVVVTAWDLIKDIFEMAWHAILTAAGIFFDLMTGKWGKAWQDAKTFVTQGFDDIKRIFSDFQHNAITFLEQAGKDLIQGLVNGLKDMASVAEQTAKNIGSSIVSGVKSLLGISSPSTVFHEIGQFIGQGLVGGITGQQSAAAAATRGLASAALGGFGAPALSVGGGSFGGSFTTTPGGSALGALGSGLTVEVYIDGQKTTGAVRKQVLRYNQRNISNGLALTGRA